MDKEAAVNQIELAERVIREARGTVHFSAGLFIVWGGFAALVDASMQLAADGRFRDPGPVILTALFAAMVYSGVLINRLRFRRDGLYADRLVGRIFGACWIAAAIMSVGAPHIFSGWAQAAVWSAGGAISLLVLGWLFGRVALLGATILLASIVGASLAPANAGYILSAGMIVGYCFIGSIFAIRATA